MKAASRPSSGSPPRGFFHLVRLRLSVFWPISKQYCSHEPTGAEHDWAREQSDWPPEMANGKNHGQRDTGSHEDTLDDLGSGHRSETPARTFAPNICPLAARRSMSECPLTGCIIAWGSSVFGSVDAASTWDRSAEAAHINANLSSISHCLGSLVCSAACLLSCANQSKTVAMSIVPSLHEIWTRVRSTLPQTIDLLADSGGDVSPSCRLR